MALVATRSGYLGVRPEPPGHRGYDLGHSGGINFNTDMNQAVVQGEFAMVLIAEMGWALPIWRRQDAPQRGGRALRHPRICAARNLRPSSHINSINVLS
jgi:hypothetical protein